MASPPQLPATPLPATQRPLTARSVIASTLLGVDPPRLPTLALVHSGELFGLSEGATRTALSRMAAAGEIESDGNHYRLSGRLLERFHRQQSARATSDIGDWDGTWLMLVLRPEPRSARQRGAFRTAARALRLAEVREGLWARPDNVDLSGDGEALAVVTSQGEWVRGSRPDDVDAFVAPFDIDAWSTGARALIEEMGRWQSALDDGEPSALAPGFLVDAAVIRHVTADPALPSQLLPASWPGEEFRAAFAAFDLGVTRTWRQWFQGYSSP